MGYWHYQSQISPGESRFADLADLAAALRGEIRERREIREGITTEPRANELPRPPKTLRPYSLWLQQRLGRSPKWSGPQGLKLPAGTFWGFRSLAEPPRASLEPPAGPAQHSWLAMGRQPSTPGGCGHYFCITDLAARSARSASERDLALAVQGPFYVLFEVDKIVKLKRKTKIVIEFVYVL